MTETIKQKYQKWVDENVNTKEEDLVQFLRYDVQDWDAEPVRDSINDLRYLVDHIFDEDDEVSAEEMTVAELIECVECSDFEIQMITE